MSKHCLQCYTWKSERIKIVKKLEENGFNHIQAESLHDKCVCHLMNKNSHINMYPTSKIKHLIFKY